jgi:hypothetical protein
MTEHDRVPYPEMAESFQDKIRLGFRGPYPRTWTLTMAEAWPVKAKHTMVAGKTVDKAADREILNHRPIAMKQHDRRSRGIAAIDIMKIYAVTIDEVADWGMPILRHHREQNIPNDAKHHQTGDDEHDFSHGHSRSHRAEPLQQA